MAQEPNPSVTLAGSGVLLHVLNTSGEPVPVQGDDDGAIETVGGGGGGGGTVDQGAAGVDPWLVEIAHPIQNDGGTDYVNVKDKHSDDNATYLARIPTDPATDTKLDEIKTALGSPLQAGGNVAVTSLPLATNAATEGKQDTGNSSLASIDGKIPANLTVTSTRLLVDPSGVTSPVSAASLPLPTGAATAAKQPALGTAGSPSVDVISVQGVGGGTPIPISGTVTSTPSGTQTITGTVDTELPTAAALSDSMGLAPTVPAVGAYAIAIDGSVARRVRCSTSGNLFVEGPGAAGAALTGRPVAVAFANGGNAVIPAVDTSGRVSITNNRIARTAHLSSATLPAAGAFTSQTPYTIPEGVVSITTYVVYTRGAAGGQVKLRPQWANGTETAYETAVSGSAASGGTLRNQIELRELLGPIVDTASAVTFLVQFDVPAGCTTFALYAAESGVTGTPGTCAITITARYGS
jgi:hypothetical protein